MNNFKYLGVTFNKSNSFTDGIEELCQHAQRAQTVLDLHFLKHKTVPVSYEIEVFNMLIKSIVVYVSIDIELILELLLPGVLSYFSDDVKAYKPKEHEKDEPEVRRQPQLDAITRRYRKADAEWSGR